MNKRAIVIYLDFNPYQFKMFKMLMKSLELIQAIETDLIVFFNPLYSQEILFENSFLTDRCEVKFFESPDLKYSETFMGYEYINSIACMLGQEWLKDYEYILRTDTDTLLTEKWNNFYPDNFTVGVGGYNNDDLTAQKIELVAKKHGLFKNDREYIKNLGSTWYGKSEDVLAASVLATTLTDYFINHEFREDHGAWPGYYRGVSTLYASEIAINFLIKQLDKDVVNLDFPSTSSGAAIDHVHIHCWHTEDSFSKMKFFDGYYDHIDVNDLDLSKISDFSLYCALIGNE